MSENPSLKECKSCGKLFDKKTLSRNGYCIDCIADRLHENIRGMIEKKGATYERYKVGLKRYVDSL